MICQTENCDATAFYVVSRAGRRKTVCRKCMEEMIAIWGWTLVSMADGTVLT